MVTRRNSHPNVLVGGLIADFTAFRTLFASTRIVRGCHLRKSKRNVLQMSNLREWRLTNCEVVRTDGVSLSFSSLMGSLEVPHIAFALLPELQIPLFLVMLGIRHRR